MNERSSRNAELEEARLLLEAYLRWRDPLGPVDVLLVLGTWDRKVPEYAAQLMHQYADAVAVVSGERGARTRDQLEPEAVVFRQILIDCGITADRILIEPRATNTYENISLAISLARAHGIEPSARWGLVCRELQSRRTALTFRAISENEFRSLPAPGTMETDMYGDRMHYYDRLGSELDRIVSYSAMGYFQADRLPESVLRARRVLQDPSGETSSL